MKREGICCGLTVQVRTRLKVSFHVLLANFRCRFSSIKFAFILKALKQTHKKRSRLNNNGQNRMFWI